jgi:hypothetical protein
VNLALLAVVAVHALGHPSAMGKPRTLVDSLYTPAPAKFSIVYDNGAGYDPGSTDAKAVGQYADTNTNTVHTTRGFSKRQIAQDVGQIFGYNTLSDGDRNYFSRLLGAKTWNNLHGANPQGSDGMTGDEAFADYYALSATGGLGKGESMAWGDVSIDPQKLHRFSAALGRLGQRQHLAPLNLTQALASAR